MTASGWGIFDEQEERKDILQIANFKIVPHNFCTFDKKLKIKSPKTTWCAQGIGTDVCKGDSGGKV